MTDKVVGSCPQCRSIDFDECCKKMDEKKVFYCCNECFFIWWENCAEESIQK